jgi:hypothetical protein
MCWLGWDSFVLVSLDFQKILCLVDFYSGLILSSSWFTCFDVAGEGLKRPQHRDHP